AAGRAARRRAGDRAEDHRLPRAARCIQLGRRPRRHPWDWTGAARAAARPRRAVTLSLLDRYSPHVVAGGLCVGLAGANLVRLGSSWVLATGVAAVLGFVTLDERRRRLAALSLALAVAGLWWGSVRLDALDRSVLAPRIGEGGPAPGRGDTPAAR